MPILFVLIALVLGAYVVVKATAKRPAAVTAAGVGVEAAPAALTRGKPERFTLIARLLRGRKESGAIERNLVTAGVLVKPSEFMFINLVVLLVAVLLGVGWLHVWPNDGHVFTLIKRLFFIGMCVYLGWRGPQMVLKFLADQRRTKLEYQLADALTIISSSLKGGYSFVQGLDMAGQQMENPIQDEIGRVIRLIQLGLDTSRALVQLSDRVNSYDYDMTVSATNIQLAVGGNLSALLEGIAATIRDRIRLRRDIAALTAQGRISAAILIALPIGIAIMLRLENPEYMSYLFHDLGWDFIYLAMTQMAVGIYWIKNLINFDK